MRRIWTVTGVLLTMTACGTVEGATQSPATARPSSNVPGPALTGGPMPTPESVLPQSRLLVLCVLTDPTARRDIERERMCAAAAKLGRELTGQAVEVIQTGDPAVLEPGTSTVLLHAAVQGGQLLVSVRRYQPNMVGELFGPPPVAVPLADGFDRAAERALDALLPPLLAPSR